MGHNQDPESWPTEDVAQVLERRMELSNEEATESAERLRDIFSGETVIEDTEIEKDERAFLWSLLLEGLVTVETQHRPHPDHGKMWRYFYWHLVPPERLSEREEADEGESTVYDEIPAEAWRRHASAA